jgi:hypothetical protein
MGPNTTVITNASRSLFAVNRYNHVSSNRTYMSTRLEQGLNWKDLLRKGIDFISDCQAGCKSSDHHQIELAEYGEYYLVQGEPGWPRPTTNATPTDILKKEKHALG